MFLHWNVASTYLPSLLLAVTPTSDEEKGHIFLALQRRSVWLYL